MALISSCIKWGPRLNLMIFASYMFTVLSTLFNPVNAASNADHPTSNNTSIKLATTTLTPGVIIDSMLKRIYLMGSTGGIESLDIDTGRVLWSSKHADQPLFVANGILIAMPATPTSSLTLKSLDPNTGKLTPGAEPIILPLPSGVITGIDETLERSFKQSVTEISGKIILSYEFIERNVSGIAPSGRSGPLRHEKGAFRYLGGKFEAISVAPKSISTENWPKELKAFFESQRILRPPWKTKKLLAITQQTFNPNQLTLKRWFLNNGNMLPDKTLFKGRALAVLASCNEQYIVVAVPSGRAALEPQYLLRYYALDSGKLVEELSSRRSVGPFCIQGSWLLTISQPSMRRENGKMIEYPLELVAHGLTSDTEIWRRTFRDTRFRGTAPPQN